MQNPALTKVLILKEERGGSTDVCVVLQKEAGRTVIKLAYWSKCQEELGATLPVIKLGCLGWSLSK